MRLKSASFLIVSICGIFLLSACEAGKPGTNIAEYFQEQLLNSVTLLMEDADANSNDVVLDSVKYGNFSSSTAEELCAFFKYKSTEHIGGLDRTLAIVYTADDLEVIASKEFMADNVQIEFLPSNEGTNYILYLGTTTYQGVPAYEIQLLKISGSLWESASVDIPQLDEFGAYYLANQTILSLHSGNALKAYVWNSEAERFDEAVVF